MQINVVTESRVYYEARSRAVPRRGLGPSFRTGWNAEAQRLEARSRAFSRFGFSPWRCDRLKPSHSEKPRERGSHTDAVRDKPVLKDGPKPLRGKARKRAYANRRTRCKRFGLARLTSGTPPISK